MVGDKGDLTQHSSWGLIFYVGNKQSHLSKEQLELHTHFAIPAPCIV